MQVVYHPKFSDDLNAAVSYLEENAPGVAEDLIDTIEKEIECLRVMPCQWRLQSGNIRRIWIQRFRYGVYYAYYPEREALQIYSLTHLSQHESAWQSRAK